MATKTNGAADSPTDRLRIVFMGTPEFAVPSLDALLDAGYEVVGVRAERLSNFRRFDDLVRFTIGKRLGIEVPPMDPRFARGVQNLREDLALASGARS